jgi:hypothetical protein
MRVRVADGPPQRIGRPGQQHLPGEEVCEQARQQIKEKRSRPF